MLNRFSSAGDGEAKVQYLDGDFRVISPGAYVRCAVSGVRRSSSPQTSCREASAALTEAA